MPGLRSNFTSAIRGAHLCPRDGVCADVNQQRLDEGGLAEEFVAHDQLKGRVQVRQENQVAERFSAVRGWGAVCRGGVAPPGLACGVFERSAGDEEPAEQERDERVGCGEQVGRGGGAARDADGVEGGGGGQVGQGESLVGEGGGGEGEG